MYQNHSSIKKKSQNFEKNFATLCREERWCIIQNLSKHEFMNPGQSEWDGEERVIKT